MPITCYRGMRRRLARDQQQVALIAQVEYILTKKRFNKTRPDKIENIWEVHWTGIHGEEKAKSGHQNTNYKCLTQIGIFKGMRNY